MFVWESTEIVKFGCFKDGDSYQHQKAVLFVCNT